MATTKPNPFEDVPDPENEPRQIDEIANLTVDLQDMRYPEPARILRGVHPKAHGCVRARFRILPDLDEELRVGLFARPGKTYQAWIRYSNCSGSVTPDVEDDKHGSRGMAIKVLDVGDEVLLDDRSRHNQDFLLINQPVFAFANVKDYLRLSRILVENNDDPTAFFGPLAVIQQTGKPPEGISMEEIQTAAATLGIVQELQKVPVANPLEVQYFSGSPFLFGPDRVAKFSARPRGRLKPQEVPADPSDDYLREALIETMNGDKDIAFDFMVQVRDKGEEGLDIENASALWSEDEFPFVPVARVTIQAPQEIDSPSKVEACERLVFTPWHALPEHQPLGGINRLRKAVYLASKNHRGADDGERRGRAGGRGRRPGGRGGPGMRRA